MLVEPSIIQAVSGLATSPAEVALLVGTTDYLKSQCRRNHGTEITLLLGELWFSTQAYIPGVVWDAHAHPGLVGGFAGLMLFASLASGLACFMLPRRYALSRARRASWTLCGVLCGPTGLLLMIASLEWPAQVACPKCRKLRVVTRDTCEHCGAGHAMPELDGTEIFETTAERQVALVSG
jgi:hypothetical protein